MNRKTKTQRLKPFLSILCLASISVFSVNAFAQSGSYIGYVYPAGGAQNSTFEIKLGGQRIDAVHEIIVSGEGVTAKLNRFNSPIGNQEATLLREQLKLLRQQARAKGRDRQPLSKEEQRVADAVQLRVDEYCNRPASRSIADLVYAEVTIAADAKPGPREIRLLTARGISNPLVFQVGQIHETTRKAMPISDLQVLGKEQSGLRNRPAEEVLQQIEIPCTVNGQIASGEVNWYEFRASKGQQLVLSCAARELIPYIADAVPGWFQPVITVFNAEGVEVAYNDDFRFKPDPALVFEVPADGEYCFSLRDAIYRGREDFVYRVSVGELPQVTSIFPLGGSARELPYVQMQGWNLDGAELTQPSAELGIQYLTAEKDGIVSNRAAFLVESLPETLEQEPNNDPQHAQEVTLPIVINGRIDEPDDWDVFEVTGRAGDKFVAEVTARRLDSPLDSILKISGPQGQLVAFNDDHLDAGSGINTHHADSYLMIEFPVDGTYTIHLGDTSRLGGEAFAYRLRLSAPRPDFELRVEPSGLGIRSRKGASATVYAIRKDGFDGPIKVALQDPPRGIMSGNMTLTPEKDSASGWIRTTLSKLDAPTKLTVVGTATIGNEKVAHPAVPCEDKMQAFLWRHLVPAEEFIATIYDQQSEPTINRPFPPPLKKSEVSARAKASDPPPFTKQQVAGRLRQLSSLYQDWLLTESFYNEKVAECEAVE